MLLAEDYYESGNAPHEALGRAARKLANGGALYLGGGVGVEKQKTKADGQGESYALTRSSGKSEAFSGPLSAVMRAFALAGASKDPNSPGGTSKVTEPAAAARLRELVDDIRRCEQEIARYDARVNAKAANPVVYSPGMASDDSWEVRRAAELRRELSQLKTERDALLKTGKVEEAAETGKPGTNFTQVSPAARKKINPIVQHYMKEAHPFTACVRDNTKRFGPERAKKVCAVVKDMGEGTTKWRKGSKKVAEREAGELLVGAVAAAEERLAVIEQAYGAGATVELAERADELGELCFTTLAELFVGGHPLGVLWQGLREAFAQGAQGSSNPAVRQALGRGGKRGPGTPRTGPGTYDNSKHPRGPAGTHSGGKFVSKGAGGATDVRTVQHKLGVSTDGKFGNKTKQAVENFQRSHGLQVDGVVGRQTLAALAGRNARSVKPGALSGADRKELHRIRRSQVRRRAAPSAPQRTRGGYVV